MEKPIKVPELRYCLYARKSSESDEKQAMSIDGQLFEMNELAKRDKINIVEVVTESHSAKETGQRPQFNYMVEGLSTGKYNAIITWAPDRISRNAGDLGRVVDLMDQGKLFTIKTHSQDFSNNPNEKFLLMILCSQAKLENDNRGINVKRGLRNKCQVGIRPGLAPPGYLNVLKGNRIATVELDPERAPIIREMFRKVADQGFSGRMVRKWMKKIDFSSRKGNLTAISKIYKMLQNPFYYGEFQYGGVWYKGSHPPIISKHVFEKVQIQLQVAPKQWNKQVFPFKKLFKCGSCGGSVTAQIKYRRTKANIVNTHIYYHCNRIKNYDCPEPYITEEELISQLVVLLPSIKLDTKFLWKEFQDEIRRLDNLQKIMNSGKAVAFEQTQHNTGSKEIKVISESEVEMITSYLLHVLKFGTPEERIKILGGIKTLFLLKERTIIVKG